MLTKIVLIGPPGAGKSSVGRALSKELSMPFIDSDSEIEKVAGKTISEIFVDDGEQVFVRWKLRLLANYSQTLQESLH
jgi:shikimate kinase